MAGPFRCPACQRVAGTKVISSRSGRQAVRRRRECLACRARFTTYEVAIDVDTQRDRAHAIAAQLRDMAGALEVW